MKNIYTIIEKFEITGRGTVVVIHEITDRRSGKAYQAEVTGNNDQIISTEAVKEWLLHRSHRPVEQEAYLLKGLHKQDIADNTCISFI